MLNLQTFQKVLALAQGAITEAGQVSAQWGGGDHIGAVQSILQTAGAIAASVTNDPTKQAEATAATTLAVNLAPLLLSFASLFKTQPAAPAKA